MVRVVQESRMTYQEVMDRLQACRSTGAWEKIARAADMKYDTLAKIARGHTASPSVHNIERIAAAMRKLRIGRKQDSH